MAGFNGNLGRQQWQRHEQQWWWKRQQQCKKANLKGAPAHKLTRSYTRTPRNTHRNMPITMCARTHTLTHIYAHTRSPHFPRADPWAPPHARFTSPAHAGLYGQPLTRRSPCHQNGTDPGHGRQLPDRHAELVIFGRRVASCPPRGTCCCAALCR